MLLDIRRIFSNYDAPVRAHETLDLSGEDFPGYTVPDPVEVDFTAALEGRVLQLNIVIRARASFECARCLEPSQQDFCVDRTYPIREVELADADAELPFTPTGKLDTRELAYTELVLEIPSVLLCSENCAGLCPVCGCRKPCACAHETSDSADERLSILKELLT